MSATSPENGPLSDEEARTVFRDRGTIIAALQARIARVEAVVAEHAADCTDGEGDMLAGCSIIPDLRAALAAEPTPPAEECWRHGSVHGKRACNCPTPPAAPHAEDGACDHRTMTLVGYQPDSWICTTDAHPECHFMVTRPAPVADPSGTGETR